MNKNIALLIALALTFAIVGCGGGDLNTVPVSGTVKVQGKPLSRSGCVLRFENEKDAKSAVTVPVNEDGTFSGDVVPGPSKVYLYGYLEEKGAGGHGEAGGGKDKGDESTTSSPTNKDFQPHSVDVEGGKTYDLEFVPF